MTRETLIQKIVQALDDNGALNENNYLDNTDQCQDVYNILENALDGIILIEGSVIEWAKD